MTKFLSLTLLLVALPALAGEPRRYTYTPAVITQGRSCLPWGGGGGYGPPQVNPLPVPIPQPVPFGGEGAVIPLLGQLLQGQSQIMLQLGRIEGRERPGWGGGYGFGGGYGGYQQPIVIPLPQPPPVIVRPLPQPPIVIQPQPSPPIVIEPGGGGFGAQPFPMQPIAPGINPYGAPGSSPYGFGQLAPTQPCPPGACPGGVCPPGYAPVPLAGGNPAPPAPQGQQYSVRPRPVLVRGQ
jgi:hypothetical protein